MVENRKFFNDPEYIIPFFSEVISRMGWKLVIDRRNSPPCVLPVLPLPLQNTSASCALSVRKKKKKKRKENVARTHVLAMRETRFRVCLCTKSDRRREEKSTKRKRIVDVYLRAHENVEIVKKHMGPEDRERGVEGEET